MAKMNRPKTTPEILVIGAGISGLCAANALEQSGCVVRVLDKGRSVGGRVATRRIGEATWDHGAQFATSRDPRFEKLLHRAQIAGTAVEWCRGFGSDKDGHTRWRGQPGMAALAKQLALGLEVSLEKHVASLNTSGDQWRVVTTDGTAWSADGVVLTAPVPQSLALLRAGGVCLEPTLERRLDAVRYERCLALLALLEAPSQLPAPGALSLPSGPIAWIADNQMKGISSEPTLTIHATAAYSEAHWDQDRDATAHELLDAAREWIGADVKSAHIHGWRYSKPCETEPSPYALVSAAPPLLLAGDAFGGPRIEGAALSGWAAAEALLRFAATGN